MKTKERTVIKMYETAALIEAYISLANNDPEIYIPRLGNCAMVRFKLSELPNLLRTAAATVMLHEEG